MHKLDDPRGSGRAAIKASVPTDLWEKNCAFADKIKAMITSHRLWKHPVTTLLNTEKLNPEMTRTLHLEFAHAFAQIFTDSLIYAMARTTDLEKTLGPLGKVSSRFLLQLNLLDELGYCAGDKVTGGYFGNPAKAHYLEFMETLRQLGSKPEDIFAFKPSPAAKAARKTFTDHYEDYTLLTCVLACAEQVFTRFAGPWAKSVAMSTTIDTTKGYHAIHVEDEHGEFIDDDHSEDSWFLFRQAVTPERYDEIHRKIESWLDTWYDFGDNVIHLARTISKK
jgi:hypothetical protein